MSHDDECGIAGRVAPGVVERLEVIDVEQEHRHRLIDTHAPVEIALELAPEVVPVVQRGQRVAGRALVELVVERGRRVIDVLEPERGVTDLDFVVVGEPTSAVDLLAIDEGPVRAAQVLDGRMEALPPDPSVASGDADVVDVEPTPLAAADFERAGERHAASLGTTGDAEQTGLATLRRFGRRHLDRDGALPLRLVPRLVLGHRASCSRRTVLHPRAARRRLYFNSKSARPSTI